MSLLLSDLYIICLLSIGCILYMIDKSSAKDVRLVDDNVWVMLGMTTFLPVLCEKCKMNRRYKNTLFNG